MSLVRVTLELLIEVVSDISLFSKVTISAIGMNQLPRFTGFGADVKKNEHVISESPEPDPGHELLFIWGGFIIICQTQT